jgi:hypothetical protein
LLWPDEVTLKEEIQAKQFVNVPKRVLLRKGEVNLWQQRDAERRDRLLEMEDKAQAKKSILDPSESRIARER